MTLFSRVAKIVENAARLHARDVAVPVDVDQLIHVLGVIDQDCSIATGTGETGAATTRDDRRTELPRGRDGSFDVLRIPRKNDSDGNLPIVRSIGCIERPAARIKSNLALNGRAQLGLKTGNIDVHFVYGVRALRCSRLFSIGVEILRFERLDDSDH